MGGWTFKDLSTLPGLTLARGTPSSYLFPAQHTRHVVHLGYSPTGGGTNSALDEWFSGSDDVWDATGLMIGSDAPPARSNPYGYVYTSEGTQHIVYESSADFGRIHELYWDNDGWHSNDLMNTPGAVLASSVPRGYGFEPGFQSNQHVVYTGIDGHVHELARSHGSWNHFDLTLDTTGAPPAVAEPFGYPFDTQGTQHVIYRGGAGSINELWWDTSGWHYEPLSAQTGASAAGSEPVGYVFVSQGTQHIDYIGTNGHVYELWWDPTGWHVEDLSLHTGTTNAIPTGAISRISLRGGPRRAGTDAARALSGDRLAHPRTVVGLQRMASPRPERGAGPSTRRGRPHRIRGRDRLHTAHLLRVRGPPSHRAEVGRLTPLSARLD